MSTEKRILIAVGIVALDLLVFAIPLTAIAVAYMIIARPKQIKEWVDKLYSDDKGEPR